MVYLKLYYNYPVIEPPIPKRVVAAVRFGCFAANKVSASVLNNILLDLNIKHVMKNQ
jgi:hypothetical protein